MPQTTAEILADVDATVARLEAYRLELEARPITHSYSEQTLTEYEEQDAGFRLPTRPALPRHTPRPPASGRAFSISGSELAEPEHFPAPPLFNPQPDWLAHVLTVTGPETALGQFREEAAGTGRLPWGPDVTNPENLSGIFFVGDVRTTVLIDQIVQIQKELLAREAGSGTVPFDLNALCPMPLDFLSLGPTSPATQAWLWEHWGTSRPLQQVEVMDGHPKKSTNRWSVSFWSADWTPWVALQAIATHWPDLIFPSARFTMSEGALLEVGAWEGSLDALLQAVRRHAVDLRTLPLRELIDQFLVCVEDGLKNRPLEQTANELLLAATLLQMRSALLLREDTKEHLSAHSAAEQLQRALLRKDALLQAVECFETRPVLGESVFGRGSVVSSPSVAETASLILTRDLLDALLSASRRRERLVPAESFFPPTSVPRLAVQDAIACWQQKLREHPECAWDFSEGVMDLSTGEGPQSFTQRKAAWAAHLSAILELAREGELLLTQLTCYEQLKVVNAKTSINHC